MDPSKQVMLIISFESYKTLNMYLDPYFLFLFTYLQPYNTLTMLKQCLSVVFFLYTPSLQC